MSVATREPPERAANGELARLVVLGDEVVSHRPLNGTERWALDRQIRRQLWQGLRGLALRVAIGLAAALAYQAQRDSFWLLPLLAAGAGLWWGRHGHLAALRRGLALRKDRVLSQVLVFDSARGRCERLAGSGLLWRRDGVDAAWRTELS